MLADEIKKRSMLAMREGRTLEKDVLRVVLGEIQTAEARSGSSSDEEAQAIIRRLIKSNEETLSLTTDKPRQAALRDELTILRSLLPQTLSVDAIVAAVASVHDAIKAASNDGQATGVAMKLLKAQGALVTGKDVTEAVKKIRA